MENGLKKYRTFFRGALLFFLLSSALLGGNASLGASNFILQGKIITKTGEAPFTSISVLETKQKTFSQDDGSFILEFSNSGVYTFLIRASGYALWQEKVQITQSSQYREFELRYMKTSGERIVVNNDANKQSLSRTEVSQAEIKSVAGGFNDPIYALNALPGVFINSEAGLYGSLRVRGALNTGNQFFVDTVLVPRAQHYGDVFSIIPAEFLKGVDLYSSGFGVEFNNSIASVVALNTLSGCQKPTVYADISSIITHLMYSQVFLNAEKQTAACLDLSVRASYLPLTLDLLEIINDEPIYALPEFYDYQLKFQYFLSNDQIIKFLFFGYYDKFFYNKNFPKELLKVSQYDSDKPNQSAELFSLVTVSTSELFNNFAVFYDIISADFKNNLLINFSSRINDNWPNGDSVFGLGGIDMFSKFHSLQWLLKDSMQIHWFNDDSYFITGIEIKGYIDNIHTLYLMPSQFSIRRYYSDNQFFTFQYSAWAKNKFVFSNLEIIPGILTEYLAEPDELTFDPRLLIRYNISENQSVSFSSGNYSKFQQHNYQFYSRYFERILHENAKSEKAWHNTVGHEIKTAYGSIKTDIFFNYFYDMFSRYDSYGINMKSQENNYRNYGAELLYKHTKEFLGFSGWLGYSYLKTQIRYEPNKDFKDYAEERSHYIKFVGIKNWVNHQLSATATLASPQAFRKIIGSDLSDSPPYFPIVNVDEFVYGPPDLFLSLRYTFKLVGSWGGFSLYLELINFQRIFYKPKNIYTWRYEKPFQEGVNPAFETNTFFLPFIPNFGIEYRY